MNDHKSRWTDLCLAAFLFVLVLAFGVFFTLQLPLGTVESAILYLSATVAVSAFLIVRK